MPGMVVRVTERNGIDYGHRGAVIRVTPWRALVGGSFSGEGNRIVGRRWRRYARHERRALVLMHGSGREEWWRLTSLTPVMP